MRGAVRGAGPGRAEPPLFASPAAGACPGGLGRSGAGAGPGRARGPLGVTRAARLPFCPGASGSPGPFGSLLFPAVLGRGGSRCGAIVSPPVLPPTRGRKGREGMWGFSVMSKGVIKDLWLFSSETSQLLRGHLQELCWLLPSLAGPGVASLLVCSFVLGQSSEKLPGGTELTANPSEELGRTGWIPVSSRVRSGCCYKHAAALKRGF